MARDVAAIQRVIWLTLVLNLAVAAAKVGYGLKYGVLAMAADGVHSSLDGASNVIGLVAIAAARMPPDPEHPYGHRKFETFAALGIGALLLLACYEIVKAAIGRIGGDGPVPDAGLGGYVVMGVTLAVNVFVSWWEQREGRRLQSEFLMADAAHTRSDVVASLSVIAALVAANFGIAGVDIVATVLIVLWIGRLAWQVMKPAFATLTDEARVPAGAVDEAAMSVTGVRDVHRIRSRGALDAVFVDLHVQVDPSLSVSGAHSIAHRVEDLIRERFPQVVDVVAHLEPHGDPVEGLDGNIVGPPR